MSYFFFITSIINIKGFHITIYGSKIIIKKFYGTTGGSGGGDNWLMFDHKRIGYNGSIIDACTGTGVQKNTISLK